MFDQQTRTWHPILESDQAATSLLIARSVAARLREREQIETAVAAAAQQTLFPESIHWHSFSVAQGYAGLAVLWSYMDACFPGESWETVGHQHLELAARGAEDQYDLPVGLFTGLSGLAFSAWQLSHGGVRYRKLLAAVDHALHAQIIALASDLSQQKHGVSVGDFDVIYGLAGVGAYLLCRLEDAEATEALRAILRSFVEISQDEAGVPRWHTPAHFMSDDGWSLEQYPYGNLNCGLAHGIPGPLALLALAQRSGIEVEGLTGAIDRLASWLAHHRLQDAWGVNWPTAVPLQPAEANPATAGEAQARSASSKSSAGLEASRTAWCYGSPGIARSLWLAGRALDHEGYCELALQAMEAVYRRPLEERRIYSPTFCHGVAGLLQITLRFAHDTGLVSFVEAGRALVEQMLSLYEPTSLLGYRNPESNERYVDQPGLLDGAPGAALALLAAATNVEPAWDRLFLLS